MKPPAAELPFADQLEWLRHRYDPGWFLGGTLRPELRLWMGSGAKRVAAVLAIGTGLGQIAVMLPVLVRPDASTNRAELFGALVWASLLPGLSVAAGTRLWRSAQDGIPFDASAEGRALARTAVQVVLATVVAIGAVALGVATAAVLTAASRGHAGILATAAVGLALYGLRRAGEI